MAEVFISWSGDLSFRVAKALRGWLPKVLQGVTPWMSTDISAGERWNDVLHGKLSASNVGVLCLTKENLKAPWLLFEAGALAKHLTEGRVIPYRFRLEPEDIETFSPPLSQFHSVSADEMGTLELLKSINGVTTRLQWEILKWSFDKCWPDFNADLTNIQETGDREEAERLRLLAKEIVDYPRAPAVSDSFISHSFIQKIADVFNERELILDLVEKANRLRKEAGNIDAQRSDQTQTALGNGEVPVIRRGSLVTNDTAYAAWRSVFREAGLNSPRMLAATLSVLPIGASPLELELEKERKSLLDKLKKEKSSTPGATK